MKWKIGYAPVELEGKGRGRVLEEVSPEQKEALKSVRRLRRLRHRVVLGIVYVNENVV